jgi:hypothetical protein
MGLEAVNDLVAAGNLANLFKYDRVWGIYPEIAGIIGHHGCECMN